MKKALIGILIAVIFFGTLTRLSNLGWGIIIGIASIIIFGLLHGIVQSRLISKVDLFTKRDLGLIFSSHLIYLGTLIFQSDGGDSRAVIAIEHVLNFKIFNGYQMAMILTWSCMILFVLVNIISIRKLNKLKTAANKSRKAWT